MLAYADLVLHISIVGPNDSEGMYMFFVHSRACLARMAETYYMQGSRNM